MKSILVLRGGALGDFVVTLPALALLRQRWPQAEITLVGNATAAALARARGLLDKVFSQNEARWSALFASGPLPPPLADWLNEFDLVVNYWPDPGGTLAAKFPTHPGQMFLAAAAMPRRAPAAAHYCEPLRRFGEPPQLYVALDPLHEGKPAADPGRARTHIALHPGSGSPRKNWPAARWREVIACLPTPVSLVLGEAELAREETASFLVWAKSKPGVSLLISPPLEELISLFATSRLFLGHDSGVSHLAAACGARCVLLFGSTDATVWAPPAPNVRVLQSGPEVSAIPVDAVRRAVTAALADQT
jgi:ADP-heptose:LPS heptosyltransferase